MLESSHSSQLKLSCPVKPNSLNCSRDDTTNQVSLYLVLVVGMVPTHFLRVAWLKKLKNKNEQRGGEWSHAHTHTQTHRWVGAGRMKKRHRCVRAKFRLRISAHVRQFKWLRAPWLLLCKNVLLTVQAHVGHVTHTGRSEGTHIPGRSTWWSRLSCCLWSLVLISGREQIKEAAALLCAYFTICDCFIL